MAFIVTLSIIMNIVFIAIIAYLITQFVQVKRELRKLNAELFKAFEALVIRDDEFRHYAEESEERILRTVRLASEAERQVIEAERQRQIDADEEYARTFWNK